MNRRSFIAGAVVGALVSSLIHLGLFRSQLPFRHGKFPHSPPEMQAMLMDRFIRELSLTPAQVRSVEPILLDLHRQMLELHLSIEPGRQRLMDRTDERLLPLLTPAQGAKLKEMRAEFEGMKQREREFLHERRQATQEPARTTDGAGP